VAREPRTAADVSAAAVYGRVSAAEAKLGAP